MFKSHVFKQLGNVIDTLILPALKTNGKTREKTDMVVKE